jgi:hypothetical protein
VVSAASSPGELAIIFSKSRCSARLSLRVWPARPSWRWISIGATDAKVASEGSSMFIATTTSMIAEIFAASPSTPLVAASKVAITFSKTSL